MNILKSKIIALRYFKIVFYFIFLISTIAFLLTTASVGDNVVRNGSISVVLMLFGFGSAEVCNYYIRLYLNEYKQRKSNRHKNKRKIIEFDKIA